MFAGLVMMLHVIIAPNSAFAEIRDNAGRYFPWSLGIAVFVAILYSVIEPGIPLAQDQPNIATDMLEVLAYTLSFSPLLLLILIMLGGILAVLAYTALIYVIGRGLGGNKDWKRVFTVMFYTEVVLIPIFVISLLMEYASLTTFMEVWPVIFVVGTIVWLVVVMVKAVKVVNGFGTAKAFGLIVLAGLAMVVGGIVIQHPIQLFGNLLSLI